MRYVVAALALSALSTPVLAQATPPSSSAPPTATTTDTGSAGTNATATNRSAESGGNRTGRGAHIKMQGPGGAEIAVRCADGEPTRTCADIVLQLLDRARSGAADRRRDMDRGDHGDRSDRGDSRFRDREY